MGRDQWARQVAKGQHAKSNIRNLFEVAGDDERSGISSDSGKGGTLANPGKISREVLFAAE
ncbi:MAG TPA: hypothetical protein VMA35_10050 [Candidatus Sulfopaludibacter sp.]|nr:hypothetical protein [Candidatus Sulfopaludibacter sp.]